MKHTLLLFVTLTLVLAGCAQEQSDPDAPANAIERYLQAVISKDTEEFNGTYCADYELEALTEFDSFGAVEATLEDASCMVTNMSGGNATVTCTGSIEVVYDGEDNNTLDLARFPYLATQEDGEWTMCGYSLE